MFAALATARRIAALATPDTPQAKDCARTLRRAKDWFAQNAPSKARIHAAARKTQSLLDRCEGKYLA